MKPLVAPINLDTSISSLIVIICRRMVLNATATREKLSKAASISTPARPSFSKASRRFAQAESSCACSTCGSFTSSVRKASRRSGEIFLVLSTKASGRGFRSRPSMTSPQSLLCLSCSRAAPLGIEREAAHIRVLLQARFDLGDGLRVCIQLQKQAQLRRSRNCPERDWRFSSRTINTRRQAESNPDHSDAEQAAGGGACQPSDRGGKRVKMMRKPDAHIASSP